MKTKYLSDKNTYDMNCHQLCSQNISEECNCPKINLQYIVDFQINKGIWVCLTNALFFLPYKYFSFGWSNSNF